MSVYYSKSITYTLYDREISNSDSSRRGINCTGVVGVPTAAGSHSLAHLQTFFMGYKIANRFVCRTMSHYITHLANACLVNDYRDIWSLYYS